MAVDYAGYEYATDAKKAYAAELARSKSEPQTDRAPQVARTLELLEKALAEVRETVHRLDERLDRVMRPESPSASAASIPPTSAEVCPLASHIGGLVCQAEGVQIHLQHLLNRLEI